jgi:hypothetical protein
MNPAKRSAEVVGAISVVRAGQAEAGAFARELAKPAHVLDLGPAPSEAQTPESGSPGTDPVIEVQSPRELSDRILRALLGQWPRR